MSDPRKREIHDRSLVSVGTELFKTGSLLSLIGLTGYRLTNRYYQVMRMMERQLDRAMDEGRKIHHVTALGNAELFEQIEQLIEYEQLGDSFLYTDSLLEEPDRLSLRDPAFESLTDDGFTKSLTSTEPFRPIPAEETISAYASVKAIAEQEKLSMEEAFKEYKIRYSQRLSSFAEPVNRVLVGAEELSQQMATRSQIDRSFSKLYPALEGMVANSTDSNIIIDRVSKDPSGLGFRVVLRDLRSAGAASTREVVLPNNPNIFPGKSGAMWKLRRPIAIVNDRLVTRSLNDLVTERLRSLEPMWRGNQTIDIVAAQLEQVTRGLGTMLEHGVDPFISSISGSFQLEDLYHVIPTSKEGRAKIAAFNAFAHGKPIYEADALSGGLVHTGMYADVLAAGETGAAQGSILGFEKGLNVFARADNASYFPKATNAILGARLDRPVTPEDLASRFLYVNDALITKSRGWRTLPAGFNTRGIVLLTPKYEQRYVGKGSSLMIDHGGPVEIRKYVETKSYTVRLFEGQGEDGKYPLSRDAVRSHFAFVHRAKGTQVAPPKTLGYAADGSGPVTLSNGERIVSSSPKGDTITFITERDVMVRNAKMLTDKQLADTITRETLLKKGSGDIVDTLLRAADKTGRNFEESFGLLLGSDGLGKYRGGPLGVGMVTGVLSDLAQLVRKKWLEKEFVGEEARKGNITLYRKTSNKFRMAPFRHRSLSDVGFERVADMPVTFAKHVNMPAPDDMLDLKRRLKSVFESMVGVSSDSSLAQMTEIEIDRNFEVTLKFKGAATPAVPEMRPLISLERAVDRALERGGSWGELSSRMANTSEKIHRMFGVRAPMMAEESNVIAGHAFNPNVMPLVIYSTTGGSKNMIALTLKASQMIHRATLAPTASYSKYAGYLGHFPGGASLTVDQWRNAMLTGEHQTAKYLQSIMLSGNSSRAMHVVTHQIMRGYGQINTNWHEIGGGSGIRILSGKQGVHRILSQDLLATMAYDTVDHSARTQAKIARGTVADILGVDLSGRGLDTLGGVVTTEPIPGLSFDDLTGGKGGGSYMIPEESWRKIARVLGSDRSQVPVVELPMEIADRVFGGRVKYIPLSQEIGSVFQIEAADDVGNRGSYVTGNRAWQGTMRFLELVTRVTNEVREGNINEKRMEALGAELSVGYMAYSKMVRQGGKSSQFSKMVLSGKAPQSALGRFYAHEAVPTGAVGIDRDTYIRMYTNGLIDSLAEAQGLSEKMNDMSRMWNRLDKLADSPRPARKLQKAIVDLEGKLKTDGKHFADAQTVGEMLGVANEYAQELSKISAVDRKSEELKRAENNIRERFRTRLRLLGQEKVRVAGVTSPREMLARNAMDMVEAIEEGSRVDYVRMSRFPVIGPSAETTLGVFLTDSPKMNPHADEFVERTLHQSTKDLRLWLNPMTAPIVSGDFDADNGMIYRTSLNAMHDLVNARYPARAGEISRALHKMTGISQIYNLVDPKSVAIEQVYNNLAHQMVAEVEEEQDGAIVRRLRPVSPTSYQVAYVANTLDRTQQLQYEDLKGAFTKALKGAAPGLSDSDVEQAYDNQMKKWLHSTRATAATKGKITLRMFSAAPSAPSPSEIEPDLMRAYPDRASEQYPFLKLSPEVANIYEKIILGKKLKITEERTAETLARKAYGIATVKVEAGSIYHPVLEMQWLANSYLKHTKGLLGFTERDVMMVNMFAEKVLAQATISAKHGHANIAQDLTDSLKTLARADLAPEDLLDKLANFKFEADLDNSVKTAMRRYGYKTDPAKKVPVAEYYEYLGKVRKHYTSLRNAHYSAAKELAGDISLLQSKTLPKINGLAEVELDVAGLASSLFDIPRGAFPEGSAITESLPTRNERMGPGARQKLLEMKQKYKEQFEKAYLEEVNPGSAGRVVGSAPKISKSEYNLSFVEEMLARLPKGEELKFNEPVTDMEFTREEFAQRFRKLGAMFKWYKNKTGYGLFDDPVVRSLRGFDYNQPMEAGGVVRSVIGMMQKGQWSGHPYHEFLAPLASALSGGTVPPDRGAHGLKEEFEAIARREVRALQSLERTYQKQEGTAFRRHPIIDTITRSPVRVTGSQEAELLEKYAGRLRKGAAGLGLLTGFLVGQALNQSLGGYAVPGLGGSRGLSGEHYDNVGPAMGAEIEMMLKPRPPRVAPWDGEAQQMDRDMLLMEMNTESFMSARRSHSNSYQGSTRGVSIR